MADVILLQIKYKEKLYEIPAALNSTAVRSSYLKGIDKQAEGLKYVNTSGNTRFLRKLGDYVTYQKMKRMFLKKYLSLFCSRLQIWHPLCLQLDYPRMKEN